ncbi:galanin-like G-protein coupled receptor npr-9 [Culicoides brevitarsis]|uniref:galanin-like G-protein coupled receptor npr-9 n=1 Tax=Culicoides brevitarsis TaxID=469753 RepID=UPI00307B3D1F
MSDEFMQLNSSSSSSSGSSSINFTDDTLDTNNTILNYAENIGDILVFYYTPVIVFVGIIGNILSVLVFFRTKLRKLSSSYYLAALGMSDSCFLVLAFISWLNFAEIHIIHHNVTCQLFFYLQGVCSFLSVWYVVAFTVERFIAVLYPLKRQSMCTVRRAVIVLCGLTVLALFFCAPLLFFVQPVYHAESNMTLCDIGEDYRHPMKVFNYIDTVLVFVIPFTGIVVLNSITGYTVWKVAGVRRSMTLHRNRKSNLKDSSGGAAKTTVIQQRCIHPNGQNSIRMTTKRKSVTTTTSTSSAAKNGRSHRSNSATSSQMKVTKMLLLVSSVFVLLNLPSYLVRVMAYIETEPSETQSASKITIILQYYCWLFFITNFGINFVLYCMSGQNFRKAVISMFSKRIQKRQQQADCDRTQVTVVTEYNPVVRPSRTFSTYRNNNRTASVRNASITTTAATVNAADGISINRHLNVLTNNNFTEFNSLACNSDESALCSPWIEMSEVP